MVLHKFFDKALYNINIIYSLERWVMKLKKLQVILIVLALAGVAVGDDRAVTRRDGVAGGRVRRRVRRRVGIWTGLVVGLIVGIVVGIVVRRRLFFLRIPARGRPGPDH